MLSKIIDILHLLGKVIAGSLQARRKNARQQMIESIHKGDEDTVNSIFNDFLKGTKK